MQQSYSKISQKYAQQTFSFKSHTIIKQLTSLPTVQKYPIQMLIDIIKLFHLNQFQIIFLSSILASQKPSHQIYSELFHTSNLKFICPFQQKNLYLYLILITYGVKYYLNIDISIYEQYIKNMIPDFGIIFQNWARKYSNWILRCNPREINKFYNELLQREINVQNDKHINYNEIVEDLGVINKEEEQSN